MAATTLSGVLTTGVHGSRPAASAVGAGGLYSCTTHSLVYQTDGSSWTTWATLGTGSGSGTVTTVKDEGSNLSTAVVSLDFVGAGVTATGTTAVTVTIPGATSSFVGAKAYATATQNTNNSSAALTLDSEEFDTDGFHSTVTATSRMTIPSGKDGKYRVSAASFASGAADWIIIKLNGTTFVRGGGQNVTAAGRWNVTTILSLVATDYVEVFASSTGSINWGHASAPDAQTTLSVQFLGA